MTNKEKQDWLKDNYPLTIITDRYSGTYSNGYYLAFPLDFDEIPSAVNGSDPECAEFWEDYLEPVGKGSSVQAAIDDLIYKMRSNAIIDVPFGAQDSELKGWEYTIPEGMEAELKDGKIIVRQKESEDEGIIRAIIDALYSHTNSTNLLSSRGYQMEDIEVWLEKQKDKSKEKSFIWTKHDEAVRKEAISCLTEWRDKKCIPYGYLVDCNNILAWLEDELPEKIEKQKEQKPILEVFGFKVGDAVRLKDGDGRKHIIKSFEEVEGIHGPNFYHVEFEDNSASDGIYPGEEYPNGYYTQMEKFEEEQKPRWEINNPHTTKWTKEMIDERFEELVEEYHKQKPAEWNEQDEKVYDYLKGGFEYATGNPDLLKSALWGKSDATIQDYRNFVDKLKILRPQPKPEWSEEDENKIESIKGLITMGKFADTNTIRTIWKLLDFLRPQPHTVSIKDATKFGNLEYERGVKDGIQSEKSHHWKPSEEQMSMLLAVIRDPNNAGSESCFLAFKSLYEDLKKLM